jgi:Kef-type K+ transport system membrane component KefB
MAITVIIVLCVVLLLAYFFDISSTLTKIPPVILLLSLGLILKQLIILFEFDIPELSSLLPALGTLGLILIVLEGALELEFNKSKFPLIKTAFKNAIFPLIALAFLLALIFHYYLGVPFKTAIINAIPFCVISSSIAIPSVRGLSTFNKEFIIYETSLSDIFGVLLFNFFTVNEFIGISSFGNFTFQVILIVTISFVCVLGLSFLLSRITHHVTFTPIILAVILIYSISKLFHLPGLIFILVFGLFLGNLDELKHLKWFEKFRPEKLNKEILKFKEITLEVTFLVRSLFFILFGYLMHANEILNVNTFPWAVAIVAIILFLRSIMLKISGLPLFPLLFVTPRGLITILLFLAIADNQKIEIINNSLIIQTIVLSVTVMTIGLIFSKKAVQVKA